MLDYKDIITKHYALGMSGRKIAESLKVSKSGVNDFLRAFQECPVLSYPLPEGITNYGIAALVYRKRTVDPAGVADFESVLDAFAAIADGKYTFVSRGDASGTHTKELSLWPEALGITKEAASFADYTEWYVSANTGMGACLVMAEEMGAYILTDKATFLTFVANDGVI